MSALRMIYLVLAVLGAVLPMWHFIAWFREFGWSLAGLIDAWYVNAATTGLVWDLTIAAVALTLFILVEAVYRRDRLCLVAIPAIFCIGLSCGLPLYLFLRSRKLP